VLNVLLFLGQWATKDGLMLWGAKVNSLIASGQWWRLLTSSFLHTSAFHLAVSEVSRGRVVWAGGA
jgi:membrane associated rhomboid family serine protease